MTYVSKTKTSEIAKRLFKVTYSCLHWQSGIITKMITEDELKCMEVQSRLYAIEKAEDLGVIWPAGAVVEVIHSYSSHRGYSRAEYEIRSPAPLTEDDLDVLRAQGCFMSGQSTGSCDLGKGAIVNGKFVYSAVSIRDSGD